MTEPEVVPRYVIAARCEVWCEKQGSKLTPIVTKDGFLKVTRRGDRGERKALEALKN